MKHLALVVGDAVGEVAADRLPVLRPQSPAPMERISIELMTSDRELQASREGSK